MNETLYHKIGKLNTRGISLVEIILTVGLLLIVSTALIQLGVVALSNSDASRMRAAALQMADESLELARAIRDDDSTSFFNLTGNYTYNSTLTAFVATDCNPLAASFSPPASNDCEVDVPISGTDIIFYRVVRITDTVGITNSKEVASYVFWNNRGTYSNVISGTVLTKWRN